MPMLSTAPTLREKVIEELVNFELFHTFVYRGKGKNQKKVYTYELEGYDKDKMEAEGSIWIVYVRDCMRDYYQKHKKEIDKEVNRILRANIK